MSEKNQMNIMHFFCKTKYKITDENSSTSINSELINESKHPQSLSDHIRKNVQTGGKKKKTPNIKKI